MSASTLGGRRKAPARTHPQPVRNADNVQVNLEVETPDLHTRMARIRHGRLHPAGTMAICKGLIYRPL